MNRSSLAVALCCTLLSTGQVHADITKEPGAKEFIAEMASRHRLDPGALDRLFRQIDIREEILRAISRPAEAKPWHEYRTIFLTETRIADGVRFWRDHADELARAEAEYGVPAEMIVAILGVETSYGRKQGSYRVVEALATLAFGYPRRASYFRGQLEQYLLMAHEEGIDPLEAVGSYAGAMGAPQFMPGSFRSYAVDFDGNGRRNLWNGTTDAIGSIANYFARHHWHRGEPVAVPVQVSGGVYRDLLRKGMKPHLPVSRLSEYGVATTTKLPSKLDAALIELEAKDGPEQWVVLNNFYVITRYNNSALYAMAAFQLSQAIRKAMNLDATAG